MAQNKRTNFINKKENARCAKEAAEQNRRYGQFLGELVAIKEFLLRYEINLVTQNQTNNARNESKDRSENWHSRRKWGVAGVTILAFLAASAAAVFTGYQASIARDTEQRQLRAYVTTEFGKVTCPDCDSSIIVAVDDRRPSDIPRNYIEVKVENSGLTPAYKSEMCLLWKPMPINEVLPPGFDYTCVSTGLRNNEAIYPGKFLTLWVPISGNNFVFMKEARGSGNPIYLYGQVTYFDAFKVKRTTPVCMFYFYRQNKPEPTEGFGGCPVHDGQLEN